MAGVAPDSEIAQILESRPISLPIAEPPALSLLKGGAIRLVAGRSIEVILAGQSVDAGQSQMRPDQRYFLVEIAPSAEVVDSIEKQIQRSGRNPPLDCPRDTIRERYVSLRSTLRRCV
jgi:hypothetical protein